MSIENDPASMLEKYDAPRMVPPIRYWLLASHSGQYTPFQGFGVKVSNPEFAALVDFLAVLPASVDEIFHSAADLAGLRRPYSPKQSSIVGVHTLERLRDAREFASGINVFIGLQKEVASAQAMLIDIKAIYISNAQSVGVVGIAGYKGNVAQLIDGELEQAATDLRRSPVSLAFPGRSRRMPFEDGTVPSRIAGVTNANERLAQSLSFSYAGADPIHLTRAGVYEEAIITSAEQARSMIGTESTDLIIYAPAMYRPLYAFGSTFWNNIFRKISSKTARELIKDGIFRNKGYSGFVPKQTIEENYNPYQDPVAGPILAVRQAELRLTASALAALASSGMQPAIRLPNSVNMHSSELRDIERYASRDDVRGALLLRRAFKALSTGLGVDIDGSLMAYIRDRGEAVTIVSDAPLEWLRIDGLPLMIRNEVSRIGMTPGNMMLSECSEAGVVTLSSESLHDVLVIRSFKDDDPVREILERTAQAFELKNVRIKIQDVASRGELIECLTAFQGVVVVFDCHGGHDGESGHGWLRIGTEKVDVWQLAHVARIPPIVVLSACSTFALAGSHASVGNGLLRSGAVTVIGTFLPVDALRSAAFVARLLYRVDSYLPALKEIGINFITWRELVASLFRMSYATDVLHYFILEKGWLKSSDYEGIAYNVNVDINNMQAGWYTRFVEVIARTSGHDSHHIVEAIEQDHPLFETLLYCQLGRPELIGVYLGDTAELSRQPT